MDIEELRENWDAFGRQDPFWAILTQEGKDGGRWDVDTFFTTGADVVDHAMSILESIRPCFAKGRALDFGCGVGRLTQGLCRHFQVVDGVDIAESMVELARGFNRFGDRCRYHVNVIDNLALFGDETFDLVLTLLVLQHMRPEYCKAYLKEFVRVLKPGGLLFFQLPGRRMTPEQLAARCQPQSICNSPLPIAALRADIRVDCQPEDLASVRLRAGEVVQVPLIVRNLGEVVWPALDRADRKYMIRVGNHWLTRNGRTRTQDDGRAALPSDLQPGHELRVTLPVTAPVEAGDFLLELDMVQEGHAWFGDRGSATCRIPVQVAEPSSHDLPHTSASEERSGFSPRMEVHGTPRGEIVAYLESCGARILDVEEDNWAGPEHESYHFTVAKE